MKNSQLKNYARQDIKNNCLKSTLIPLTFLSFFLTLSFMTASLKMLVGIPQIENSMFFLGDKSPFIVNIISALLTGFIYLLIFAPASAGVYEYFISPVKEKKQDINSILNWYSFKRILVSLKLSLTLFFLKSFMLICFCAPSVIVILGTLRSLFYGGIFKSVAYIIFAGAGIMLFLGVVCFLCAKERYAIVPYIIAMLPETKIKNAIRMSREIMQGEYLKFFMFKLSFLPLILSCIFILPIAFVWQYYRQSCTEWVFYTVNKQIYK